MKLIRKMLSTIILFILVFSVFCPVSHVHAGENFAIDTKQKSGLDFFFSITDNIDAEFYGGSYFDENGNLVMLYTNYDSNIKSVEESIISEAQSKDFVDIKRVPFSYKELREYQNKLIKELDFQKTEVNALDIDIINNKVQIFIKKLDDEKVRMISSLVPIEAVDFIEGEVINIEDEMTEDDSLVSDDNLANAQTTTITLTAGQKISYANGKASSCLYLPRLQLWNEESCEYEPVFLAAGHISASEGDSIFDADNSLIGTVAKKVRTNEVDISIIKENPDYNYQYEGINGKFMCYLLDEEDEEVDGYGLPVNTKLTAYSYLGNKTGLLVSNDYTYVNGNVIWSHMIRTTINTAAGYSGAPIVVDDSDYTENKVILGYHKGKAVVGGEIYAFHAIHYYMLKEISGLKFKQ